MNTKRNRLLYTTTIIVIIIIFLVIFLSGSFMEEKIYVDVIPKQPMNNIYSIEEEKPINQPEKEKNKDDNDKIITYVYGDDKEISNYIYLINQFPISDEIGKGLEGPFKTFDFKIEFGKKSLGMNYEITLEKMEGTDLQDNWVKVFLTREGQGLNCFRTTGRIKTYNEYDQFDGSKEITLFKGIVTNDDVKKEFRNYRLRMWISDDVTVTNTDYEKKTFIARVNVRAKGSI